jgi:hypothetical protein
VAAVAKRRAAVLAQPPDRGNLGVCRADLKGIIRAKLKPGQLARAFLQAFGAADAVTQPLKKI